ncbi:heme/hemin ABC transporter substrate-binding protein [Radicibacter daui]|uniref:heme/hemin ABC transporter substrate-binding protein n=1 Tax=Radicibacter daui TaxID=3064829 RepID=UPI00404700C1
MRTLPLKGSLALMALLAGLAASRAVADEAVRVPDAARIVSADGSVTEILVALGYEDRLVAVDTTSLYPPEVTRLPKIGYARALSAEGLLSLHPDVIVAGHDAGPPEVLAQVRASGVPLALTPAAEDGESLAVKIRAVGEAVGADAAADSLAADVEGKLGKIETQVAAAGTRPRVLFLMSAGEGAPRAAGAHTSAAAMIALAGGINAAEGYDGYKPISAEAAVATKPDYIVVPSHTAAALGGADKLAQLPQLALTPAAQKGNIVVMDTMYLLGFGPRTPDAVADLFHALHPGSGPS